MNIPESLDVLGKKYHILLAERETGDYGECTPSLCKIEVASYQCEDQRRDTLLHETLHAIDHEMHCSMSEPQIRRMATGVLAVLRQNPQLAAFLLGSA
jgi:hypothetical protein